MNKILIVVVHHSGKEKTLRLCKSIVEQTSVDCVDLRIVDNSIDIRERMGGLNFTSAIDKVEMDVIVSENRGYFGSANFALNDARDSLYKYVIICNNDITFDKEFVKNINQRIYAECVMAIYPALFDSKGKNQNPRVVSNVSRCRLMAYRMYYSSYILSRMMYHIYGLLRRFRQKKSFETMQGNENKPYEVLLGAGACILLTKEYFRHYDNLPNEVFLFGEEALLAKRIYDVEGKINYDGILKVYHEEHSTVGLMGVKKYWEIQKESSRHYIPALWKLRERKR